MFRGRDMSTIHIEVLRSMLSKEHIADYARISGELSLYAKEGLNIMIKNEWFEQPPQAIDHKELAGV